MSLYGTLAYSYHESCPFREHWHTHKWGLTMALVLSTQQLYWELWTSQHGSLYLMDKHHPRTWNIFKSWVSSSQNLVKCQHSKQLLVSHSRNLSFSDFPPPQTSWSENNRPHHKVVRCHSWFWLAIAPGSARLTSTSLCVPPSKLFHCPCTQAFLWWDFNQDKIMPEESQQTALKSCTIPCLASLHYMSAFFQVCCILGVMLPLVGGLTRPRRQ